MPLDITEFMAEINRLGLAPANKFEVMIAVPTAMRYTQTSDTAVTPQVIAAYCDSTQIPGLGFQMQDVQRYGYGPTVKSPMRAMTNDWSCVFYSDAKGQLYKFFQSWMRLINNFSGSYSTFEQVRTAPYEFAYRDEYVATIIVKMYNQANEPFLQSKLLKAHPIIISDQTVNRNSLDELLKFQVLFTFQEWTSANLEDTPPQREPSKPVLTGRRMEESTIREEDITGKPSIF